MHIGATPKIGKKGKCKAKIKKAIRRLTKLTG